MPRKKIEKCDSNVLDNNKSGKNQIKIKKIWLAIGISSAVLSLASIITPITIAIINDKKQNINEYIFTNNDIVSLKQNLTYEIMQNHLTIDLFKINMLVYFKTYLKASNINISNLIISIQILSYSFKFIEFKVILDSNNNEYLFDGNNKDIRVNSNILDITYQGVNAIDFFD